MGRGALASGARAGGALLPVPGSSTAGLPGPVAVPRGDERGEGCGDRRAGRGRRRARRIVGTKPADDPGPRLFLHGRSHLSDEGQRVAALEVVRFLTQGPGAELMPPPREGR